MDMIGTYKYILVVLILFLAGNVLADIEKQKKSDKKYPGTTSVTDTTRGAGIKAGQYPPPERKHNSPRAPGYDDFIDKNNNGIDDRMERRKESNTGLNRPPEPEKVQPVRPKTERKRPLKRKSSDSTVQKTKRR
jgi:hypothetical protein